LSQSPGASERETLSAELTEFLIEFSIALHRTLMYPAGHPSQEKSAEGVVERLHGLLEQRGSVSIGVARRQLVIEGIATDPKHPVLRGLAEKFHKQHIGAVVFDRGVSALEVADMMRTVALEAERGERPLGLGDPERLRAWQGARLFPLTYDQLELVGDPADEEEGVDDDQRDRATRSAQLWIGLARAALSSESREPPSTDATAVAQAINEHPEAQAYDQVLVGYLLQLAQELKQDSGGATAPVRKRMSKLIGKLDPATLQRLVQMGGDLTQRKQFVLDATEGLAVDAVVEIVRAAAQTSGQNISSSLMRMLSKLSAFAERGPTVMQTQADHALREQVRDLISDWKLTDPNPDAYTRALQSMSTEVIGERVGRERFAPEPLRIIQMALEVEAVGVPFWRAVRHAERNNQISELVQVILATPPENKVASQVWNHLATEQNVRALLKQPVVDFAVVNPLLDRMPAHAATEILLQTLMASELRSTRMGAYRRLVTMGETAVPRMLEALQDDRWYVQRNMLAMLNEMQHVATTFAPADFARHSDPRVRREAIALWLRMPGEQERATVAALKDPDERVLRIGVAAAQRNTPESAVPLISNRLVQETLPADLRIHLVRMFAHVRNPLAVDGLIKLIVAGKSFMGKPKLAEKTPFMLVALTTLAGHWQKDPRARAVLERAAKSKDPEISAAARAQPKS
jgi:hypothetical protein